MTATWRRAINQAPLNNDDLIIAQIEGERYQVGTGAMLHALFQAIWKARQKINGKWRWTPYSDELWIQLQQEQK